MTEQLQIGFDGPRLSGEDALICSLLASGRNNARSVDLLAEISGIERRQVEKIVRRLITTHNICIGSSSGKPFGYYLITEPAEIEAVYKSLRHRGIEILKRAAKLKKISVEEVFGQERIA